MVKTLKKAEGPGETKRSSYFAHINCVDCGAHIEFGWSSVSQEEAERDAEARGGRSCAKCIQGRTTIAGPYSTVIAQGGINWCWYLALEIDPERGACRVLYHDRFHRFDERQMCGVGNHPSWSSASYGPEAVESEGRVVTEYRDYWRPDGERVSLRVTNAGYTFGFEYYKWAAEVRELQALGLL